MYFYDYSYVLVIIAMLIVGYAQFKVNSTFSKFSQLESERRIEGRQAAAYILQQAGIQDVRIEHVRGNLTDHYDPRSKVLRLSDATYNQTSVAAVAVAAHECGHAIQHAQNYSFLSLRSLLAPVVQIGSSVAMPMILIGLILQITGLINIGIIAFASVLLFQVITLPVEFDASKRAMVMLQQTGIFTDMELPIARKVLNAAAFTYIAATISTALQLTRFILMSRRRR